MERALICETQLRLASLACLLWHLWCRSIIQSIKECLYAGDRITHSRIA